MEKRHGKRHAAEQIIRKLREADTMLAAGKTIGQVVQVLEVSEQTYHRWRNQSQNKRSLRVHPCLRGVRLGARTVGWHARRGVTWRRVSGLLMSRLLSSDADQGVNADRDFRTPASTGGFIAVRP